MLNVAIQAIRKAGAFVVKQYEFINRSHTYLPTDHIKIIVSKTEKESKHIITTVINKFYPSHLVNIDNKNILYKHKINHIHWIVESLDNKINFIKQFPFFALSIAVQYKEQIEIGVIYDPIHNELFSACRGKGAQCNGYRIRLDHNHNITKYLNTIILSLSCFHVTDNVIIVNILHKLNQQFFTVDFRRTGSIILDLVYIAIGRVDGCLIVSLKKTNKLSSAILIIKESGGFIVDFNGNGIHPAQLSGNIIIGNSKIIKIILSAINQGIK